MKRICLFDVNETLLDLRILDPEFEKIFGSPLVRKEWFGQFIDLWAAIKPLWHTHADFCIKQKLGIFIYDNNVHLYSPYRPIDAQIWSQFTEELLTIIDMTSRQAHDQ